MGVAAVLLILWVLTQAVRFRHRHVPQRQEPPFGGVPVYPSQQYSGQPLQLSEHAQPPYLRASGQ